MLKLVHSKNNKNNKKIIDTTKNGIYDSIYVCCCWSGDRRFKDIRYIQDKTFYIKNHVENLHKYKHNLNHIVFAVSENGQEEQYYKKFLKTIPKQIQKAKVEVITRPNVGMSYGALSDIYLMYKNKYKYYFTIEDDWAFVQNDFDSIFINKLESKINHGFVCALSGRVYADISVGCIKSDCLDKITKLNNGVLYPLPYANANKAKNTNYNFVYYQGQYNFGVYLRKTKYIIVDLANIYYTSFRDPGGGLRFFNKDKNKEAIVLPM